MAQYYIPKEGDRPLVKPTEYTAGDYEIQSVQLFFWNTDTPLAPETISAPWQEQVGEELEAGTIEIGWRVTANGGGETHVFNYGPIEIEIDTSA